MVASRSPSQPRADPTGTTDVALMSVPIEAKGTLAVDVPIKLFEGEYYFNQPSLPPGH